MTMKRSLALVVLLALSSPALAQTTYPINVILPLTGPSAFVGGLQQESLRAFETQANRNGGLRGMPIHFIFLDDQSNPQVAVQLANQVKESHPAVMLGSSIVAMCAAIAALMTDGPIQYCLSPGYFPTVGSYTYASSPSLDGITPAQFRFLRLRGLTRIAVIGATDASAQAAERITLKTFALPENASLKNVAYEHFNASDISVAAQIGHIKAADPQALVVYASGPAFLNILRAMRDTGLDVPLLTSTANLVPSVLDQNKAILPTALLFNGYAYEDGSYLGKGPLLDAANEFEAAYKAIGSHASPLGALAWDPAKLLLSALRSIGPNATAAQVRDWLSNLTNFAGVMGVYDFKHITDQHGLPHEDVVIIQWDPKKSDTFPVSKLGGAPF
jgi:branched-chain amino acid transport system substrate-binding protein